MESVTDIKNFYINDIKKSLNASNLSEKDLKEKKTNIIPHQAESNEEQKKKEVEVVVFKRSKKSVASDSPEPKLPKYTPDKNLLQAKKLLKQIEWDVTKFGMTGFSLKDKRKMEQDRAVTLGAKPRKNEYVNYKVLMEEKKKQRLNPDSKKQNRSKMDERRKKQAPSVFWKESTSTRKFGQVGNFKGGVLKLSRKDIKALNPTK